MKTAGTSPLSYAGTAGFTCVFYIAPGITSLKLGDQSQAAGLLYLLQFFSALVLGVTLYTLTREEGSALAPAGSDLSGYRSCPAW